MTQPIKNEPVSEPANEPAIEPVDVKKIQHELELALAEKKKLKIPMVHHRLSLKRHPEILQLPMRFIEEIKPVSSETLSLYEHSIHQTKKLIPHPAIFESGLHWNQMPR